MNSPTTKTPCEFAFCLPRVFIVPTYACNNVASIWGFGIVLLTTNFVVVLGPVMINTIWAYWAYTKEEQVVTDKQ